MEHVEQDQPVEVEAHPLDFGSDELAFEEDAEGGFLLLNVDIEADEVVDDNPADAAEVAAAAAAREEVLQLLLIF